MYKYRNRYAERQSFQLKPPCPHRLLPYQVLSSVLKDGAPALRFAKPYLLIRSFSFMPALVSLVGFSAFRGMMDTVTPVQISLLSNLFHVVLDPILIFAAGFEVPGAAISTLTAELVAASAYLILMRRRKMIPGVFQVLVRPPTWKQLQPLIRGGAALQLRNLSLNLTFLAVARVVQSIDDTGVAAAAHALSLQTFQLGGIVFLAMSTVSQVVVPNETVNGGKKAAKAVVHRLMSWGLVLGVALGSLQLLLIPIIQRSSPLAEVRSAARVPAILASVFQVINGLVFIGEGVMVGTGSFMQLSVSTLMATIGCLLALHHLPSRYGLVGVWLGFGVFNTIRLMGVITHQRFTGPLARGRMLEE
jgi:putative MATE family efflux protein